MDILIKGMEMPKSCEDCNLESFCDLWVEARRMSNGNRAKLRHPDCPLVPVPPHGRLIDEDEVRRLIAEMIPVAKDIINSKAILEWVAEYLPQCHTVIEAEEGE